MSILTITQFKRVLGPSTKASINAAAKKYAALFLASNGVDPLKDIAIGKIPVKQEPIPDINLGDLDPVNVTLYLAQFKSGNTSKFSQQYSAFQETRKKVITELGYDPNKKERVNFSDSEYSLYRSKMAAVRFSYNEIHIKTKVDMNENGKMVSRTIFTKPILCLPEETQGIIDNLISSFNTKWANKDVPKVEELKGTSVLHNFIKEMLSLDKKQ